MKNFFANVAFIKVVTKIYGAGHLYRFVQYFLLVAGAEINNSSIYLEKLKKSCVAETSEPLNGIYPNIHVKI